MSNYEDIKEKIIESLPVCGTCRHMLLEVWSEDVKFTSSKRSAHIASLRRNDGLESDDPENFFVVRCVFKKQAVMYPLGLIICDAYSLPQNTSKNSE